MFAPNSFSFARRRPLRARGYLLHTLAVILFCLQLLAPSWADAPSSNTSINPPTVQPLIDTINLSFIPPTLSSPHWIVVDFSSRTVIAQKEADTRIEPASMTKVMTAYLVFQALSDGKMKESDTLTPIKFTEGSTMFLDERTKVSVGNLIRGMIIQSGNDASLMLARAVAGSDEAFVVLMNDTAKKLGMSQTHFINPHGLPHPEHTTTLKDLAILAMAVIRDFPQYYSLYAEKEFTYNNIRQPNRNALLHRNIGVDGIKTGHTESAGYCLMSSAIRGERRVVVITAKSATEAQRFADSEALINALFDQTETVRLYAKDQSIESVRVWRGDQHQVNVGFTEDVFVTLPQGKANQLSAQLHYQQPLSAPIKSGATIGQLQLSLGGVAYAQYPVVALRDVGRANFLVRAWHNVRLWLNF